MNTTSKGTAAELAVAKIYADKGYLVASRRHIGGAADLVAYLPGEPIRLIEVKSSSLKRGAYADFPPKDRQALSSEAEKYGGYAILAWMPKRKELPSLIPESDWP